VIETTTKYICDKCKKDSKEFFKLQRVQINTVHQQPATNYRLYGDGIMMSWEDTYPAYHLCGDCVELLAEFLNPST
jgi:hypothetical protein